MKNLMMTLVILCMTANIAEPQIPNNGFEDWTNVGNGLKPTFWYTPNSLDTTGIYFSVTRSSDHFPQNVGSYSIRLENQPLLLPGFKAYGLAMTTRLDGSDRPLFAISGHPTSLCGYFKFLPQNGDTMDIHFAFYKNGTEITSGELINTDTFTEWTSFNIPVENIFYDEADSARITVSSLFSDNLTVYGNSVLYVDNLSFDIPISALNDPITLNNPSLIHPNPASDQIFVDTGKLTAKYITLCFYDVSGRIIKTETIINVGSKIITKDLICGVYLVEILVGNYRYFEKLIIKH